MGNTKSAVKINGELNVSPERRAIVKAVLQKNIPNIPVWAFGSRTKNQARAYSDLDLAIIGETPLSLSLLTDLNDVFSQSDLLRKVDIVHWVMISEEFKKLIQQHYIVLQ